MTPTRVESGRGAYELQAAIDYRQRPQMSVVGWFARSVLGVPARLASSVVGK